jgi:hypothetical protein
MGMDGFATFALTGRDGFATHPCELVIVGKGYKPFPTFGCWVGNKIIQPPPKNTTKIRKKFAPNNTIKSREGFVTLPNNNKFTRMGYKPIPTR